jgi:LSD1 subclass zinc finger protein
MRDVYAEWIQQCPQAVSPRAGEDQEFRRRMVDYLVESTLCKDFDPTLAALEEQLNAFIAALRRIPRPEQPWLVSDGIWQVAQSFRALMEATYRRLDAAGVLALDPDQAPPGVPLSMEYSTFCQGWLPHLQPADGPRLLSMFGLSGEYARVDLTGAVTRRCGGCGGELVSLADAGTVVCQGCGRRLDLSSGESPCQGCGAALCFPEGVSRLNCPYCQSTTHRA